LHGVARSTLDSDLVADLKQEQAAGFAQALEPAFYVDMEMIQQAIQAQSSLNIIRGAAVLFPRSQTLLSLLFFMYERIFHLCL